VIQRACLVGPAPGERDVTADVVGGLPTLLRQALSLQDVGIRELLLVGVPSAQQLRGDRRVQLTIIEVSRTGQPPIQGPALVARAGVVWDPAVLRRLAKTSVASPDTIAVGSAEAAVYLAGAERVGDAVARIASGWIDKPIAAGPPVAVYPTTPEARQEATRLLLRSLDKPADGFVSRYFHRRLSKALTSRLLSTSVTPNAMTLAAALFGVAGVAFALRGGYWNILAGALLFELQNILDGCDGEIARVKFLGSRAGEWLDQIVDDGLNIAFLVAVAIGLSAGDPDHWLRQLAWAALAAQIIHLAGLYAGLLLKAGGRGSVAVLRWWVGGGTETDPRTRFFGDLTRRDFYSLLYVLTAAAGVPAVALVWHALITVASAVVSTVQWMAFGGPALSERT
jgi:phosphatidylglycerophosphate synthase